MNEKKPKNKKPVRVSRIVGYGLLIIGCVSIINFFSPIPIPTVGISALVSGFLFIAAGLITLIPDKKGLASKIRTLLAMRSRPPTTVDPLIPVRILKLAHEHHGVLTVSTVAVELTIPLAEAEAGLEECMRSGQATVDFDMDKEIKYYKFQEFLPPSLEKPDAKRPWDV